MRLLDLGTGSNRSPNLRPRSEVVKDLMNDGYSEYTANEAYNYITRPTEISS